MKRITIAASLALLAAIAWAGARGGTILVYGGVAAHGKPTVALANLGAGPVDSGVHAYKQTWVNAGGETLASVASANVTTATATNGKVNVTVPELPADATGANLYRTKAGGATYYLLTATPIVAGVYVDEIADASLPATEEPAGDTSSPTVAAPDAPAVALANLGAGLCTTGAHLVKVAYTTAGGVSALGTASDAVTTNSTTNGKIVVSVTASTNPAVTGARIYMTKAGGSTYYLAASGVANTTADTTVSVADASLTALAPTGDSSSPDVTLAAATGRSITYLWLRNNHATEKVYVSWDPDTAVTLSTSTSDWIPANGGTLEWFGPPGALKGIRLHGETTAPTVTYRLSEQ